MLVLANRTLTRICSSRIALDSRGRTSGGAAKAVPIVSVRMLTSDLEKQSYERNESEPYPPGDQQE